MRPLKYHIFENIMENWAFAPKQCNWQIIVGVMAPFLLQIFRHGRPMLYILLVKPILKMRMCYKGTALHSMCIFRSGAIIITTMVIVADDMR